MATRRVSWSPRRTPCQRSRMARELSVAVAGVGPRWVLDTLKVPIDDFWHRQRRRKD